MILYHGKGHFFKNVYLLQRVHHHWKGCARNHARNCRHVSARDYHISRIKSIKNVIVDVPGRRCLKQILYLSKSCKTMSALLSLAIHTVCLLSGNKCVFSHSCSQICSILKSMCFSLWFNTLSTLSTTDYCNLLPRKKPVFTKNHMQKRKTYRSNMALYVRTGNMHTNVATAPMMHCARDISENSLYNTVATRRLLFE